MGKIIIAVLLAVLVLCGTLAVAQNYSYNQLNNASSGGRASMYPDMTKEKIQKMIKSLMEMGLIYKLVEQPNMVSVDNGVIVAYGNTLRKYDKDLNFVKEVDLDVNVDQMQDLAGKFADKYATEFMDVMSEGTGLAGSSLGQAKMTSNDALAKATLRAMSTAAESYATANNGAYPLSLIFLTSAKPPYLNTDYCASSPIAGYNYDCSKMSATGYTITATPVSGSSGTTVETISTGGVLTP